MKQAKEKYYTSPHTGTTYRIDEKLGKNKKEPMFPEKIVRAAEIIRKADMSILEKKGLKNNQYEAEEYFTSPTTGMTYRIDPELGKHKRELMFPEKIEKMKEFLRKVDTEQLKP